MTVLFKEGPLNETDSRIADSILRNREERESLRAKREASLSETPTQEEKSHMTAKHQFICPDKECGKAFWCPKKRHRITNGCYMFGEGHYCNSTCYTARLKRPKPPSWTLFLDGVIAEGPLNEVQTKLERTLQDNHAQIESMRWLRRLRE